MSRRLACLSWVAAREVLSRRPVILLPLGSTEAHGPHLPLDTDVLLSEGMARRAAEALAPVGVEAWIAPTLAFGVTHFAEPFSGTVSISGATLRALLREVCERYLEQGARAVVLINSHLELEHIQVLRELSAALTGEGKKVLFPDKTRRRWVATLSEEFQRGACHAGAYETSLLLAERPEVVGEERLVLPPFQVDLAQAMRQGARTFRDAGAELAYFGDPASATAEHGEWLFERLTQMVVATVLEGL